MPMTAPTTLRLSRYESNLERQFVTLNTDPVVRAHMDGALETEAARRFFRDSIVGSQFCWAVMDDSGYVGHAYLVPTDAAEVREIGFLFAQRVWGRGYATEVVRRLIEFAAEQPDVDALVATADLANEASLRVLDKHGFVRGELLTEDGIEFFEFRLAL